MTHTWKRLKGGRSPPYERLPLDEKEPASPSKYHTTTRSRNRYWGLALVTIAGFLALYGVASVLAAPTNKSCDTIDDGYRCSPEISHFWGQYSLWFSVESEIDVQPPKDCSVTFASVLSRHGGRDPTQSKTTAYGKLIADIQNKTKAYPDEFAFLKNYKYSLGADQLTDVGRQEMVNSGAHFYRRYSKLVATKRPFVRSSGQDRVVESANKWLQGFAQAGKNSTVGTIDVSIPEAAGVNNTLSHELCAAFEDGPFSKIGDNAQTTWQAIFVPPIQSRVNSKLGLNLTTTNIIYLMDMCPFDTLTSPTAKVSDFCHLFTEKEWHQYDYYESLGKYYGYGNGNPLGPTQGVGFVNELLARLTEKPVIDHTSTNRTLDSSSSTFPLDRKVYADFSHDNDMSAILGALGVYNDTTPLSNTTVESSKDTRGYSAAWTVPFAARIYFEKLSCKKEAGEFVRIIVNDRVQPLKFCEGDKYGRCTLDKFVKSQTFAQTGGRWNQCFVKNATMNI